MKIQQATIVICSGAPECGIDKCDHYKEHAFDIFMCNGICVGDAHCRLVKEKIEEVSDARD